MMLLVKVPGNAVQVYDGIMVQAASKSKPITLKYQTEIGLLAGHVRDMNNHSLVNLKVHAVAHKPRPQDKLGLFSWRMLNSGQLAIQPHIIQIQQTQTDSQGHFQFKGIPSGYAIDLMIQGVGIPKTRREHIEKLPVSERAKLLLQLPKASTITGRINAQAYPDVGKLSVAIKGDGASRRTINIGANQQNYAFTDLEAGTYVLTIYGKRQTNNFEGTFFNPRIEAIYFDIGTAETKAIDIGFSSPPKTGAVLAPDTESPGAETPGPGGDAVDGLQIHLRTEKRMWGRDEVPEFKADALVVGEGELGFVDPPMGVSLEYDGAKYGIRAAGALSIGHPPIRRAMYGLGMNLNGDHYRNANGQPLVLTPGTHTIRLVIFAQAPEGSTGAPKYVYSNPVEIVVGEDHTSRK